MTGVIDLDVGPTKADHRKIPCLCAPLTAMNLRPRVNTTRVSLSWNLEGRIFFDHRFPVGIQDKKLINYLPAQLVISCILNLQMKHVKKLKYMSYGND